MIQYVLLGLLGIVCAAVMYVKHSYTYWKRKGVYQMEPDFFFGNCKNMFTGKAFMAEEFMSHYKHYKDKGLTQGGGYMLLNPFFMPVSPDVIKLILMKDFQHFSDHGMHFNEERDPLSAHLFNLQGTKWRNMRLKLSPTFTGSKIKGMFQTLVDCTDGLVDLIDSYNNNNKPVDTKDVLTRFTMDIIGSCVFGLEFSCLKDSNSPFLHYGRKAVKPRPIRDLIRHGCPALVELLGVNFMPSDIEEFFVNILKNLINYRDNNNVSRKDFVELLLNMRKTNDPKEPGQMTLTINEIVAQCFIFFIAGFETSATLMIFTLYELSKNPHIQTKVREEINTVLNKHNGKFTYEAFMQMTYLEKVMQESLRKYPPLAILLRQCTKTYTLPDTNVVIEKGTKVIIPTLGLHYDPEYYPNPEVFDPERFSEENKQKRPDYTWLPFGEGPRICIGVRFGMLQSKLGVVTILQNYELTLNSKTKQPLTFAKDLSLITSAEGGIFLDCKKI